jgi:hypothetical protein
VEDADVINFNDQLKTQHEKNLPYCYRHVYLNGTRIFAGFH